MVAREVTSLVAPFKRALKTQSASSQHLRRLFQLRASRQLMRVSDRCARGSGVTDCSTRLAFLSRLMSKIKSLCAKTAAAAAANNIRRAEKCGNAVFRMPCEWATSPRLSGTELMANGNAAENGDSCSGDEDESFFLIDTIARTKDPNLPLHLSQIKK